MFLCLKKCQRSSLKWSNFQKKLIHTSNTKILHFFYSFSHNLFSTYFFWTISSVAASFQAFSREERKQMEALVYRGGSAPPKCVSTEGRVWGPHGSREPPALLAPPSRSSETIHAARHDPTKEKPGALKGSKRGTGGAKRIGGVHPSVTPRGALRVEQQRSFTRVRRGGGMRCSTEREMLLLLVRPELPQRRWSWPSIQRQRGNPSGAARTFYMGGGQKTSEGVKMRTANERIKNNFFLFLYFVNNVTAATNIHLFCVAILTQPARPSGPHMV